MCAANPGSTHHTQRNTLNPYSTKPNKEWRGAGEPRTQAHTPTLHGAARSGEVQAERAHKHTRANTPANIDGPRAKAQTNTRAPRTPARIGVIQAERAHKPTRHNTAARKGVAQPTPETKHTQPDRTPQPRLAARRRNNTNTHTPTYLPQLAGRKRKPELTHMHHGPQPGSAGYRRSAHTNTHPPPPSQE